MKVIGVDTGGTFTDVAMIGFAERIAEGKAPSTPAAPAEGVLASIEHAAGQVGMTLAEALGQADVLAHGTTVGVNALLTGNGARTALIMTAGFEDTVPIARINKVHGIDERYERMATHWEKPPLLLPRENIVGAVERVDSHGEEVLPLDEDALRATLAEVGERGVEAVGVSLLWSFIEPAHERRVGEIVREVLGEEIDLTLSSELAPRIGEYERTMTVLLNSYVAPVVNSYLRDLERRLGAAGFAGSLMIMRSGGGVQTVEEIVRRPIETLRSGPVGGLGAAAAIGAVVGHGNVISTDVGGTSFEVGLLVDGEEQHARQAMIGRYALSTPVIDIESIGTGGGSVAWIDPIEKALKIGPHSAGAVPGPASYGRGGELPTVTDAAVALGYLEHLGGDFKLDRAAAERAVAEQIAEPLGMTTTEAAEGILRVASSHMADLVRRMTVQRGYDPRRFVLYAFGGAAPQYVGRYARDLGVEDVVVPVHAPMFSALGAALGDFRTAMQLDAPRRFPPEPEWMEEQLAALRTEVDAQLAGVAGTAGAQLKCSVALRFARQVHEVWMPLPDGPVSEATLESLAPAFEAEYERQFGQDTAYSVAGIELVGLRVDGLVPSEAALPERPAGTVTEPSGSRRAWFDGAERDCPLYDGETLAPEHPVPGPAFIETPTTTTVVYPGQTALVDRFGNLFLRLEPVS
jgi:N-methylhydantoinase A